MNDYFNKIQGSKFYGNSRFYQVGSKLAKPKRDSDGWLLPPGWTPITNWTKNSIMKAWADIVGHLLISANSDYKIKYLYIEFENVTNPNDPIVVPYYGRETSDGAEYYASLSSHGSRDYLRVPVIAGALDNNNPNVCVARFFGESVGSQGVHGKPFSASQNSKIFGGAIAAGAIPEDPTRDIVFARNYLPIAEQTVKDDNSPVALQWRIEMPR